MGGIINTSYLASAESLLNGTITETVSKAVVASRIAQQYARQNNTLKVSELFRLTKQLINAAAPSKEKDKILEIVLTNYSYPLVQKSTTNLLSSFQSDTKKIEMNERISRLSEISTLLLN